MTDVTILAGAIADAPEGTLNGLATPDERSRRQGAVELARWIVDRVDDGPAPDGRQLGLPL